MVINIKPPPIPPRLKEEEMREYADSMFRWCAELAVNLNRMLTHIDGSNITSLSFGKLTDVSICDEDIVSVSYGKLTDIPET